MSIDRTDAQLNLTRKWRSLHFEEIVGQPLVIRILKNSLYRNHFFPVYLLSGKRGCGKTSTARVFAAAVNCHRLPDFQKEPQSVVMPCMECDSCIPFVRGNHPDFIEVDAASYTGVDNVRQIIESAHLMPLIGRKKIYLIDEVHMLSKSAFNAFLKILEEPPAHVLFILATTEVNKVIDTVRSRSFQLFFGAIDTADLCAHLKKICISESINYEDQALELIVRESQGSARDALNLLERVRFSGDCVTEKSVCDVLGYIHDGALQCLLNIVTSAPGEDALKKLMQWLNEHRLEHYCPEFMWRRVLEMLTVGIKKAFCESARISPSVDRMIFVLDTVCQHEALFLKTHNKHLMLEALCIRLVKGSSVALPSGTPESAPVHNVDVEAYKEPVKQIVSAPAKNDPWAEFVSSLKSLNDPLVSSIFQQSSYKGFDTTTGIVTIVLSSQGTFFRELIEETKVAWIKNLKALFGDASSLHIEIEKKNSSESEGGAPVAPAHARSVDIEEPQDSVHDEASKRPTPSRAVKPRAVSGIDISDAHAWQKTHLVLQYFPGTVDSVETGVA